MRPSTEQNAQSSLLLRAARFGNPTVTHELLRASQEENPSNTPNNLAPTTLPDNTLATPLPTPENIQPLGLGGKPTEEDKGRSF